MPTLSELQQQSNDAEHQAFQRAYDALLDIAKDPITCRHFWDAGFTAGQADANDMLTVAHMDGYSKGRDAMRRELVEALREGRRAIGEHSAPHDCYATGPLTGDEFIDLVQCPACCFIAKHDAVLVKWEGKS
ncbi:MAG TPA: hypothetical protein DDZ92_07235 [Halomonas sp.]|nr:hypothetical protein [Halomonas sp.]|tara:strand:- start:215 stop:610 length:396 start_codon:yes stop_codon:yes gene_type:complete